MANNNRRDGGSGNWPSNFALPATPVFVTPVASPAAPAARAPAAASRNTSRAAASVVQGASPRQSGSAKAATSPIEKTKRPSATTSYFAEANASAHRGATDDRDNAPNNPGQYTRGRGVFVTPAATPTVTTPAPAAQPLPLLPVAPAPIQGAKPDPAKPDPAAPSDPARRTSTGSRLTLDPSPPARTSQRSVPDPRDDKRQVCKPRPSSNKPTTGGGGGGPRKKFVPWC